MRAPSALRARVRVRNNDRPTRGARVKSGFHFLREAVFIFSRHMFFLAILRACISHVLHHFTRRLCNFFSFTRFLSFDCSFFSLWAMEILWGIMGGVYFEQHRSNTLNKIKILVRFSV